MYVHIVHIISCYIMVVGTRGVHCIQCVRNSLFVHTKRMGVGGLGVVHREFLGSFESTNLSSDDPSREIGRKGPKPENTEYTILYYVILYYTILFYNIICSNIL